MHGRSSRSGLNAVGPVTAPDLLPPHTAARLAGLQLLAKNTVEGFRGGLHKSPLRGSGAEFKQHRGYVPGDDPRTIDWKLYGKTDRLFVREHEEETNLRCTLLVDCSGSMAYAGSRSGGLSKHAYAVRCAAALAHLLLRQQDGAGLVTFGTTVRRAIPPRSRPRHLQLLLTELAGCEPDGETDLGEVLNRVAAKLPRRGLVVLLSDLFGDVGTLTTALARFRHGGHEVLCLQVLDPDELDFPFDRRTEFRSLETSAVRHTVDPAQARRAYLDRLDRWRAELKRACGRQRVGLAPLRTDRPVGDALAALIAARGGRR